MKTHEISHFETSFYSALTEHLKTNYKNLKVVVPSSGSYVVKGNYVPAPDVVVENPDTGRVVVIEVKGFAPNHALPFATLPRLKVMKQAFGADATKVFLVSSAEVPSEMRSWLQHEDIAVTQTSSVNEAIETLDKSFKALSTAIR